MSGTAAPASLPCSSFLCPPLTSGLPEVTLQGSGGDWATTTAIMAQSHLLPGGRQGLSQRVRDRQVGGRCRAGVGLAESFTAVHTRPAAGRAPSPGTSPRGGRGEGPLHFPGSSRGGLFGDCLLFHFLAFPPSTLPPPDGQAGSAKDSVHCCFHPWNIKQAWGAVVSASCPLSCRLCWGPGASALPKPRPS